MGTPEQDLHQYLADGHKADMEALGKEEWIADKAIEIRGDSKLMDSALEWYAEETGVEELFHILATWAAKHEFFDDVGRMNSTACLKSVLAEIAEEYATQELFPEHLKKLANGDFCG